MAIETSLMERPSPIEMVGLVVGAIAMFPATWWFLGRVDKSGDWIIDPDYAVQPPQIDRGLAHLIGGVSVVVAVVGASALFGGLVSGRWHRCVAGVFAPFSAGFAYAGIAGHIITAPVIGANIGAGLILMGALPVGAVLIVIIGSSWRTCRKAARLTPTAPGSEREGPA